jgi:hypothetical protein
LSPEREDYTNAVKVAVVPEGGSGDGVDATGEGGGERDSVVMESVKKDRMVESISQPAVIG